MGEMDCFNYLVTWLGKRFLVVLGGFFHILEANLTVKFFKIMKLRNLYNQAIPKESTSFVDQIFEKLVKSQEESCLELRIRQKNMLVCCHK